MPNSNLWAPNDQPLVLMESPGPGQPLYLNKDLDPGVVRDLVGILMFLRLDPAVAARGSLGTQNILFFEGTVLRLPRQGYYQYLFVSRIMPLGSWPLSSSYAVFYFCRKSLIGLEGAGVGVMTQVPGFALEKQDFDFSLYFTVLLQ
ncbi:hypothetical protein F2Q69_00006890 [Brassica cretica]|uniref:Uncharacterized protein n=1 Tax=Brassica cretica TaxID=69181 RepID=A0A8S9P270_BRACR|nr:hypothetical protein F2Q69_00006890 [Brassica cretica]